LASEGIACLLFDGGGFIVIGSEICFLLEVWCVPEGDEMEEGCQRNMAGVFGGGEIQLGGIL
jgi:hypothetical protein